MGRLTGSSGLPYIYRHISEYHRVISDEIVGQEYQLLFIHNMRICLYTVQLFCHSFMDNETYPILSQVSNGVRNRGNRTERAEQPFSGQRKNTKRSKQVEISDGFETQQFTSIHPPDHSQFVRSVLIEMFYYQMY